MITKEFSYGKLPLLQLTDPYNKIWIIRFNECNESGNKYVYDSETLNHTPTIEEIKDIIFAEINNAVNTDIEAGLTYNGHTVTLSVEKQLDYRAIYDVATATNGANLPATLKVGKDYVEFTTIEQLKEFYTAVQQHIQSAVVKGWEAKKNITLEEYESILSTWSSNN